MASLFSVFPGGGVWGLGDKGGAPPGVRLECYGFGSFKVESANRVASMWHTSKMYMSW